MTAHSFFRDKNGKVAILQPLNLPILGWLITMILSMLIHEKFGAFFETVSFAFLFLWAYLEITSGDSMFRRTLGGIVMATIVLSALFRVYN